MIIPIANVWPVSVPLPLVGFGGKVAVPSLYSPKNSPLFDRRKRFKNNYSAMALNWNFSDEEFSAFESFFAHDLGNGTSRFSIELRFPDPNNLTSWVARFSNGYSATRSQGRCAVQASVDLDRPVVLL